MIFSEEKVVSRPLQVGSYEIIKTLARHKVTKTEVAIKIIDKTRLDKSDLKKINRELPGVCGFNQDMLYIVTEYTKSGEMFGKPKKNLLTYKSVFCLLFLRLPHATNTGIIFHFQRLPYLSWLSK
uniref:Protein kinase domain-containing protein n=1 Tax=Cyprinus carpio TaxID=7962 RepID=A0A8C2BZJ1_CYPCA